MNTKRINGFLFEKLLYNGLANLRQQEETLNALNVFPVADGDTGSNMCTTLENGLRSAKSDEVAGNYLRSFNDGLLMGARGNSGVILSQLFNGVYQHLARCSAANCGDMRNAFIRGYKTAYQAVVSPVEGTILTVAREGIENIRNHIDRGTTMEAFFAMYVAEMKKSLAYTTHLLPELKNSGVVDSGAMGYIAIIEGMGKYLNGEVLHAGTANGADAAREAARPNLDAFNAYSRFDDGYCMEFILQLMAAAKYEQDFKLDAFIDAIRPFGESIVATQSETRVKVHIHTKEPAWLISLCQKYGEFITFKLENMQLQHNEHIEKQAAQVTYEKPLAVLAAVNAAGLRDVFQSLGCECIMAQSPSMHIAQSAFEQAFEALDAETIVVLPNDEQNCLAASRAATVCRRGGIHVLPAKNIPEGYFAVSMDVGNLQDVQQRIVNMRQGLEGVTCVTVKIADAPDDADDCAAHFEASVNGKTVFAANSAAEALAGGLSFVPDLSQRETCFLLRGEKVQAKNADELEERILSSYSWLELCFADGGQTDELWICGII